MKGKTSTFQKEKRYPYLLILPSVLLILGLTVIPTIYVFDLSLQNLNFARPFDTGYVGLANFRRLLTQDPNFFPALWFTVQWVVAAVSSQVVFGMMLALALNSKFKFRGFARAVSFIPWAVSGVLTATLWSLIYNQHVGPLNDILVRLGALERGVAWVSNPSFSFLALILAETWRGVPFFAITILAALQSIPQELYEACEIDGGEAVAKFRYVTLIYLKDTIILTTLLRCIWTFNNVDMIFTMTGGGPHFSTTTLTIYMVKTAVVQGNYGYGSAIGVFAFMILIVFASIYIKASRFGSGVDG